MRTLLHAVAAAAVAAAAIASGPIGPWAGAALAQPAQAKPLYLLIYDRGPAWIAGKPMHQQKLAEHVAYMRRLIDEGRIVAGGPFGEESGGMAILRADSSVEAEKILQSDPGVLNGTFVGSVRQWTPVLDSGQPLHR